MSTKRMLNLGCGSTFHKDWFNIDFTDHDGQVMAYDLRLGIPFDDNTFDVIYHSHVIEHMPKAWGEFLIAECFRVLRPSGILRVVAPDLENIAIAYLDSLNAARLNEDGAKQKHQWMITELIDQLTRTESCGEMFNIFRKDPLPQKEFILERFGKEAEHIITQISGAPQKKPDSALPPFNNAFLLSGENHKWMYDEVSLTSLLLQSGFEQIQRRAHNESLLPKITTYGLDTTKTGIIRKPDSFFMEAIKPAKITMPSIRVAMFSTTDSGGAAIAALRLHNALQSHDISSHMYVAKQNFFQNKVHVIPTMPTPKNGGIIASGQQSEVAVRRELFNSNAKIAKDLTHYPKRPHGSEHFSTPAQCVNLKHVPLLNEYDILHFHWISGLIEPSLCLKDLKGKKIVWTLHDMNSFTGGCHYSNGCRKFEQMCGACPELGSNQEKDLAFETWRERMGVYRELNMHIVAPSKWLANEAKKSALLKRFPIHVIPYAQPLDIFKPLPRTEIRQMLGLKPDALTLLFASQSLTSNRKGGIYLLNLLHVLAQSSLKERICVFLLGNNTVSEFMNTGIEVRCLGHIDNPQHMATLYNATDAVLVPSLEDNQPNVVCEALGCGTPVIAFANGGIVEMIRHEETGYLAPSKSLDGLLQGVSWANSKWNDTLTRKLCRAHALEQWSHEKNAQMYVELYKSI